MAHGGLKQRRPQAWFPHLTGPRQAENILIPVNSISHAVFLNHHQLILLLRSFQRRLASGGYLRLRNRQKVNPLIPAQVARGAGPADGPDSENWPEIRGSRAADYRLRQRPGPPLTLVSGLGRDNLI
ncbi:hypothetical protein RRG08_045028 [Elysia crispata]|uniref:Uncharacterized protein n=1 Tax=Elysia crispata TaxID=231223 RepID=A0AAE0Y4N9_9GAST|nr:hypothetical protein RRG08_045028 [Elysia crispata]